MPNKENKSYNIWFKVLMIFVVVLMMINAGSFGFELPVGAAPYTMVLTCILVFKALKESYKQK